MTKAHSVFFSVATEFMRAAGLVALTYSTGIFNAPDFSTARALSLAMLFAALCAGFRAVQKFVDFITWAGVVSTFVTNKAVAKTVAAWLDAFSRAAVASFLVTITGWLAAPDFSTWKSVGLAAVTGMIAAGFRAVQGLVTPTENPLPGTP